MKTALWIIVGFVAVGMLAGGVVRNPDGTVDVSATVDQGASKGGEIAGQAADNVGNSIGHSIGSAVDSSDLAKVAVAGAAAAGVAKAWPKNGPSFKPKPVTEPALSPPPTATTQPPKRRTGWCRDVVSGAVQPCERVGSASTSTTVSPISPGFTAPSFRLPEATWKPCVATPGMTVNC